MAQKKGKKKSKLFRVATEGMTTDGRTITRQQIQDMADTYDPDTYGARIWMEHLRSYSDDGLFPALGDVLHLEAKEVQDGKLGLFAQIEPLPLLVNINQRGQKIYTSIEMATNFAGSGKAYMYGLGVTDSPASLGTDKLQFSAQNIPKPDDNKELSIEVSEFLESEMEFFDVEEKPNLIDQVKSIFSKKEQSDDARFADVHEAVTTIAKQVQEYSEKAPDIAGLVPEAEFNEQKTKLETLETQFNELKTKLEGEPHEHYRQRPPADGGEGLVETDC